MASYTETDLENARKFSNYYNGRIRVLELLHKKFPFIASHLTYTIRDATNDDYMIPASLAGKAKIIDINISETLCGKLSCNKYTATGFCQPETRPHYVYVGDDGYDAVCQPACFRFNVDPTFNKDGSRSVDLPQLSYRNGRCLIVPDFMTNYLEKSWYREDSHYVNRSNDMPTGFSRVPKPDDAFGWGYTYRNNATYCKYYDRTLDDSGDCSYSWWEKGLDALVGMSFINTIKSSVRNVAGKARPFDLPENLPPLRNTLADDLVYEKWRSDVKAEFKVPPLMVFEDPEQKDRVARAKQLSRERQRLRQLRDDEPNSPEASSADWWKEKLQMIMEELTKTIFSQEFLESILVNIAYNQIEKKLKGVLAKLSQDIGKLLGKQMATALASAFPVKCLQASIMNACRSTVTRIVIRTVSRIALTMLKITSMALSVVGWIMIVGAILDIIFAIWDPYGYNNMFPSELPNDMMERGDRALRTEFGTTYVEYSFDLLCNKLLSKDDLTRASMEGLIDQLVYLNAIEVNSDGSVIDKGDPVYSDQADKDGDDLAQKNVARRFRFNAAEYRAYNDDFLKRVVTNNVLSMGMHVSAVASLTALAFGLYTLALVAMFACLVLAACTRLSLTENTSKQIFNYLGSFGRRLIDNVYYSDGDNAIRKAVARNDDNVKLATTTATASR